MLKFNLVVILVYTIYFVKKNSFTVNYYISTKWFKRPPLPEHLVYVIKKHSPFYNSLSPEDQLRFCYRVKLFVMVKEFVPRGTITITDEMKVLIATSAVQITFGFGRIDLKHFRRILIYKNDYYSKITRQYHQGEVNPRYGIIVVSWSSFLRGLEDKTDGVHLGLHEMAHALKLENRINNDEFGFLNMQVLKRWNQLAKQTLSNPNSFFRDRAYQNIHEFFAVCVECLFEKTEDFKQKEPELFFTTKSLLRLELYLN
jgi:Mlc titration factor MtfA (ptsG expression regulator)